MPQTIIVSNRLPISIRKVGGKFDYYPSAGGLATGLADLVKQSDTIWIGWPGVAKDELEDGDEELIRKELAKHRCIPVFLTKKQIDYYLNGYSNTILWPFLHTMPTDTLDDERFWRAYKQVNEQFAEAVLTHVEPEGTVWVHDYQLMLLPEYLHGEHLSNNSTADWKIGYFLHITFPSSEHFMQLPHHRRLLQGLLGADLVGFHTKEYAREFLNACCKSNLGIAGEAEIILPDRVVKVADFPMGIDYVKFSTASHSSEVKKEVQKLKEKYHPYKTILTVDRLDPTKGFKERLQAYRNLLKNRPDLHGKVMMIMLAVPTRGDIETYKRLKKQVEQLVTAINKQFQKDDWQPIDYMYTSLPFAQISALYQVADVAFVAPIRDGMNLVAKEYIASKSGSSGVLILSETAGAASELGEALLVNPNKPASLNTALTNALTMPPKELSKRLRSMQGKLQTNTVQVWAGTFMQSLEQASAKTLAITSPLTKPAQARIRQEFCSAHRRLLLLDYDGVLATFVNDPADAKPDKNLARILRKLSSTLNTDVVIISGRSWKNLDEWIGKLPVTIAAEHGSDIKYIGGDWQRLVDTPTDWKNYIRPSLEKYAKLTPGAFVEEKAHSLVWHYRAAQPYAAQKNIVILKRALRRIVKNYGVALHSGNKILEIKPTNADKGAVAAMLMKKKKYDFVMAMGDDYTDETMFRRMPRGGHSIKVGRGLTAAKWRLNSVATVQQFLDHLCND